MLYIMTLVYQCVLIIVNIPEQRLGGFWEERIRKARDAAKHCWAQDNARKHFCNDHRLLDFAK
jgi:hypothetical protein